MRPMLTIIAIIIMRIRYELNSVSLHSYIHTCIHTCIQFVHIHKYSSLLINVGLAQAHPIMAILRL